MHEAEAMETQIPPSHPPSIAAGLPAPKRAPRGVWLTAGATLVVAVFAVIALNWHPAGPNPKGDVIAVVKYVSSSRFEDLTEKQKRPYMDALRFNIEKVNNAHKAGTIDDKQFKLANQYAWMARQLEHMDEYFALRPGKAREAYLDSRIDKKLGAGGKINTEGSVKDDEFMQQWSQNWPRERQDRFEEYREAMKARAKARGIQ